MGLSISLARILTSQLAILDLFDGYCNGDSHDDCDFLFLIAAAGAPRALVASGFRFRAEGGLAYGYKFRVEGLGSIETLGTRVRMLVDHI